MCDCPKAEGALSKAELDSYRTKINSAPRIIFHRYSHLDDAACQWFLREVANVQGEFVFLPNDAIEINQDEGEIGLDVIAPGAVKGYQHADGSYSSAFRFVVEVFFPDDCNERRALEPLVKWVDGDDNTGSATKALLGEEHHLIEIVGLTNQFHAYKSLYESHGDAIINQRYGEQVLSPIYLHQVKYEEACQNVQTNCEIYQDGIVGVCLGHVPREAQGYPQKLLTSKADTLKQIRPTIFMYRDPKMGLGMIRMIDDLRLDKVELQEFMNQFNRDEWFFHPGGFMAACGSGTTPRNPDTIPVPTEKLVQALNEIYGD